MAALSAPGLSRAATFTVGSSGDAADAVVGDGVCDDGTGVCTLRAALQEANRIPGLDSIRFSIAGAGPHAITPFGDLPTVTDPVTIDGSTQPGYSLNALGKSRPAIEIRGSGCCSGGLSFASSTDGGSTVRGLAISGFGVGQILADHGVLVADNLLGLRADGTLGGGFGFGIEAHDHNVIRNNVISGTGRAGVHLTGPGNVVAGNFIGTDAAGSAGIFGAFIGGGIEIDAAPSPAVDPDRIGGINPTPTSLCSGDCNLIAGPAVLFSIGARQPAIVTGNFVGTDVTGTVALRGPPVDVAGDGTPAAVRIGGTTPGERNVLAGGVALGAVDGTVITGNFIGTDATGTTSIHAGTTGGVSVGSQARNVVIGGAGGAPDACTAACNLISGNGYSGVFVASDVSGPSPTDTTIDGNFIGTDITGALPVGNQYGIRIGGTLLGPPLHGLITRNRIAFNVEGILLDNAGNGFSKGNRITRNAIFANALLGIDIGCPAGVNCLSNVNPNDVGDGDTGPNDAQNYPVITRITVTGASTTVTGNLDSIPNRRYQLEFFRNASCDESGFGEGQEYVGTAEVDPNTTFTVVLPIALVPGQALTATATDPEGNTSEFSECLKDFTVTPLGTIGVHKTVAGQALAPGMVFTFQLRSGASPTSDGTQLATVDADAAHGGSVDFPGQVSAGPGFSYQVCEAVPPGWKTSLPNTFAPNGNANIACSTVTLAAEEHLVVEVDNTPPSVPVNHAPSCPDRSFATPQGKALSGTLACTDEDRDALSLSLVAGPSHGTAVVAASGAFTYTPAAGYVGPDSFTYRASDGALSSDVATVRIDVADTTPPTCKFVNGGTNAEGYIFYWVQLRDTGSGLASVKVTRSVNAVTVFPSFSAGTTQRVTGTETHTSLTLAANTELEVLDVAGNKTVCDPITTRLTVEKTLRPSKKPLVRIFTGLPAAESKIELRNGSRGLQRVRIVANGHTFWLNRLRSRQVVHLDVARSMHPAGMNTITVTAYGPAGASAVFHISD